MGRDSNGDPDAPDVCFVCQKELDKGRVWCVMRKAYIPKALYEQEQNEIMYARCEEQEVERMMGVGQ
jgi:hypothetical protein